MIQSVEKVYAGALFELAMEQDKLEVFFSDLTDFNVILKENPDLNRIFILPSITKPEKIEVLTNVFKGKIDDLFFNFICILIEKGRMEYLDEIYQEFKSMYYQHNGIVEVLVTTAFPLKDDLKQKLTKKIKAISGKSVVLVERIDTEILGGIILKFQNKQVDASVKSKMENLHEQIDTILA